MITLAEDLAATPISLLYTLASGTFMLCFVTQAMEFHTAGVSAESLLHLVGWLGGEDPSGSESLLFLQYHMKRSVGVMVAHSLLPFAYLFGNYYFVQVAGNQELTVDVPPSLLRAAFVASVLLPVAAVTSAHFWRTGALLHPLVKKLRVHGDDWSEVASDINVEFRRIDKLVISTNSLSKVVVTDNWVVQVGQYPWKFNLAHQSDVKLEIVRSDNFHLSVDGQVGGTQFLSINVSSRRPNAKPFGFRLNSLEYQNLQDRIRGQIFNADNVEIFKSVSERFVEVFREQVEANPHVQMNREELEPCIGCMITPANVALKRRCSSGGEESRTASDPCVNCYCRPMWCVDCMGKWFASRQDQQKPETWLESKCPCPTCRSRFCMLDICLIDS